MKWADELHIHGRPMVSLDTARRRSVGEREAHVDAPYTRSLIGDAAKDRHRSVWEDHPRLDAAARLAIVLSIVFAAWIVAIALGWGLVGMIATALS